MQRTAELRQKIQDAMNEQLKEELTSAYQYLAMAAYLETVPLPGAAHWMRLQAQEEVAHAMKFYEFISDRNGRVMHHAIPEPRANFGSPLEVFEQALANEQKVTAAIMDLYELAIQEKDYVSHSFLQSFLNEQVEEEKTASHIVDMMRLAGDKGPALFMLDKDLASRSSAD